MSGHMRAPPETAIWVEITRTRGSAPRDAGTAMKVTRDATEGTIGGGALEHRAIAAARDMLAANLAEASRTIPLGPDLGQCCGGAVTLRFTRDRRPTDVARPGLGLIGPRRVQPLWVWGAGHVGRAIVRAADPLAFAITWVDSGEERFPAEVDDRVRTVPAADMARLAPRTPDRAHHLILTYSHEIDLALCAALLRRGAGSIGLIGSDTKRARFFRRLGAMGLDPSPIVCPIGDKTLGKHPDAIAQGTLVQLAALIDAEAAA